MTQAPTPGPLSGDFNVEEYVADYEFRADEGSYSPTENERALLIDAIHGAFSEASLGLAPAPVEASGSEREAFLENALAGAGRYQSQLHNRAADTQDKLSRAVKALQIAQGTLKVIDARGFDKHTAAAVKNALAEINPLLDAAIRPQPSGETREATGAIGRLNALLSVPHLKGDHSIPGLGAVSWDDLRAILALLSARPLGGQHSSGAGRIVPQHSLEIALKLIKTAFPDELYLIEALSTAPFSTTPARAEALDEGAAGDEVAYFAKTLDKSPDEIRRALASLEAKGLIAHPSPTPAADSDRVRIAVEAITKAKDLDVSMLHDGYDSGAGGGNYVYADVVRTNELFPLLDQALSALKSTAAQERGA